MTSRTTIARPNDPGSPIRARAAASGARRGFARVSFGELLAGLLLGLAVFAALAGRRLAAYERARVTTARTAMRDAAVAAEAFYVDHERHPPSGRARGAVREYDARQVWQPARPVSVPAGVPTTNSFAHEDAGAARLSTFRLDVPATLTSPVAYLPRHPRDPFARTPGATLGWFAHESGLGFLVYSFGPDRDENAPDGPGDLDPRVERLYDITAEFPYMWRPPAELIARGYDPTNGLFSDGDLYRVMGE